MHNISKRKLAAGNTLEGGEGGRILEKTCLLKRFTKPTFGTLGMKNTESWGGFRQIFKKLLLHHLLGNKLVKFVHIVVAKSPLCCTHNCPASMITIPGSIFM